MAGGHGSYNEKYTDQPWLCSGTALRRMSQGSSCPTSGPGSLLNLPREFSPEIQLELIQSEDHQGTQLSSSLSLASSSLDAE